MISTMPHGGKWFLVVSQTSDAGDVRRFSRRIHTEIQRFWTGDSWSTGVDYAMDFDTQQEALEYRAGHRIEMEARL